MNRRELEEVRSELMLKKRDEIKSVVETKTGEGPTFDSERFKSQIEFILERLGKDIESSRDDPQFKPQPFEGC